MHVYIDTHIPTVLANWQEKVGLKAVNVFPFSKTGSFFFEVPISSMFLSPLLHHLAPHLHSTCPSQGGLGLLLSLAYMQLKKKRICSVLLLFSHHLLTSEAYSSSALNVFTVKCKNDGSPTDQRSSMLKKKKNKLKKQKGRIQATQNLGMNSCDNPGHLFHLQLTRKVTSQKRKKKRIQTF